MDWSSSTEVLLAVACDVEVMGFVTDRCAKVPGGLAGLGARGKLLKSGRVPFPFFLPSELATPFFTA